MKNLFLNNSISFLSKYNKYSENDLEKLKYGLEGIYLTFTKLVVIILMSLILKIFKEVVIILLLFNLIRYVGFGVHAKKSSECLISSLLFFIAIPYLFLRFKISNLVILIMGITFIISYLIYAPADTVKRPFYNKRKILIRKILTVVIGIIYLICSLLINNYSISILFIIAMLIETIVINPLTYKIMGVSYNNGKSSMFKYR